MCVFQLTSAFCFISVKSMSVSFLCSGTRTSLNAWWCYQIVYNVEQFEYVFCAYSMLPLLSCCIQVKTRVWNLPTFRFPKLHMVEPLSVVSCSSWAMQNSSTANKTNKKQQQPTHNSFCACSDWMACGTLCCRDRASRKVLLGIAKPRMSKNHGVGWNSGKTASWHRILEASSVIRVSLIALGIHTQLIPSVVQLSWRVAPLVFPCLPSKHIHINNEADTIPLWRVHPRVFSIAPRIHTH